MQLSPIALPTASKSSRASLARGRGSCWVAGVCLALPVIFFLTGRGLTRLGLMHFCVLSKKVKPEEFSPSSYLSWPGHEDIYVCFWAVS